MPKKTKKQKQLFSEAFPPNKRGFRPKLFPSSETHSLLDGVKINSEEIVYKPIPGEYLEEVKKLHKEWFPVDYSDKFFQKVFEKKNYWYFTIGAFYNFIDEEKNENKEILVGLALCEWTIINNYIINHVGKDTIKEICRNIDFNEEVQSYLKCEDYRCVYIMTIGVLDEYRKMNIGRNILNRIIDIALEDTLCVGVFLDVVYYNHGAIKFYNKNNFKQVSYLKNYYDLDGGKYDCSVFFRIFKRKEKDNYREKHRSLPLKIIHAFIITPINFIIKVILFILLFQCFYNKIKTD